MKEFISYCCFLFDHVIFKVIHLIFVDFKFILHLQARSKLIVMLVSQKIHHFQMVNFFQDHDYPYLQDFLYK